MIDDRVCVEDVLEAIRHIEKYTARGRDAFEAEELIRTWVLYHLQIIGEASRKVSADLRQRHSEMPWVQLGAMRIILGHDSFGVDHGEIWATVEKDLPELKRRFRAVFEDINPMKES